MYTHEECSTASGSVSASVIHGRRRQCSAHESQIHTKWVCLWTSNNAGLEPYTMLDMSSLLCRDKNEPTKTLRPFCRNTLHGEAQHSRTPLGVHVVVAGQDGGRAYSTNGGRHDCLVRDANDAVLGTPDLRGASPEAVLLGLWRRPSWPRSSSTSAGSFAGGAAGGVSAQISHRSCCPCNRWELPCQGSWLRRLPLYIRAGTLLPR